MFIAVVLGVAETPDPEGRWTDTSDMTLAASMSAAAVGSCYWTKRDSTCPYSTSPASQNLIVRPRSS